jgi:hypothetical protein
LSFVGCEPQGYLPCPAAPVAHGIPVPRSSESTIDFELSAPYVTELIRSKLDVSGTGGTPTPSPSPTAANSALVLDSVVTGADILRVTLDQKVAASEEQSLIGITFVPWLMPKPKTLSPGAPPAPSPSHIRIGGPYTLTLKLVPSRSQQGGPIALTFDFVELNNELGRVACSSSVPLDLAHLGQVKDVEVLTFIYSALGSLAIPLPDQDINDAVSKIGGAGGNLQGLAWATDGALKLGLLIGGGAKHRFENIGLTTISLAGGQDWAIDLDINLIKTTIRAQIKAKLEKENPGAVVLPADINVGFEREGLLIDLSGTASGCHFTASILAKAQMVREPPTGKSLLQIIAGTPTPHVDGLGCQFLQWLTTSFSGGSATATIWSPLSRPPCTGEQTIAVIEFPLGTDRLYGTAVNTNGGFLLSGRSVLIDNKRASTGTTRPPAPPDCAP